MKTYGYFFFFFFFFFFFLLILLPQRLNADDRLLIIIRRRDFITTCLRIIFYRFRTVPVRRNNQSPELATFFSRFFSFTQKSLLLFIFFLLSLYAFIVNRAPYGDSFGFFFDIIRSLNIFIIIFFNIFAFSLDNLDYSVRKTRALNVQVFRSEYLSYSIFREKHEEKKKNHNLFFIQMFTNQYCKSNNFDGKINISNVVFYTFFFFFL